MPFISSFSWTRALDGDQPSMLVIKVASCIKKPQKRVQMVLAAGDAGTTPPASPFFSRENRRTRSHAR